MADDEKYTLKIEVEEVMKEIAFAVKHVQLSRKLQNEEERVYFNLETKEADHYCIELTPKGFRLVGHEFDKVDDSRNTTFYETIYSLLDSISPMYRNTFGDALIQKLQSLQDVQDDQQES